MGKAEAREIFYGMTMDEWRANYQTDVSATKQAEFEVAFQDNVTDKS